MKIRLVSPFQTRMYINVKKIIKISNVLSVNHLKEREMRTYKHRPHTFRGTVRIHMEINGCALVSKGESLWFKPEI